ncbi:hypothetical protein RPMA_12270 [Tardiphaga alba]|uniref:Nucleotide modification associated domain-containing protein n=1 Tax=Tardiphaga alba TaxID=340268 RepID=A0ABX8A7B3_9BRAD|nr:Nmad5 family putative nucleotide modification protein [Tardiphaga alba]QUS39522.1 hypothetical protein RPMA_12270 [Tardiphaga alba]
MSLRLTNDIREQISLAVLRHRFSAEVNELMALRAGLADDIYNDFYRKADRDKIDALPDGWLPKSTSVSAKFGEHGSGYSQIEFTGRFTGMLNKLRPQPHKTINEVARRVLIKHQHTCWKVYEAGHKLSIRHDKLRDAVSDLESRVRVCEKQIEQALNSVTTAAALVKAWPEVAPFVAAIIPEERKAVALPVAALNEALKLPVKKAA